MHMSRRDFIKKGGMSLLMLSMAGPLGLLDLDTRIARAAAAGKDQDNVLVLIQLSGGNDGLNTVIPFTDGTYRDSRPTLAIGEAEALVLNDKFGLHPSMSGMKKLFDQKKVAIINGVSYPNPIRSHFRSTEIWQTADPKNTNVMTGWMGRYLDLTQSVKDNPLPALYVGESSKVFSAKKHYVPVLDSHISRFQPMVRKVPDHVRELKMDAFTNMYGATSGDSPTLQMVRSSGLMALDAADLVQSRVKDMQASQGYSSKSALATDMQMIAQFIDCGIGTRAYFAALGGFDEHIREKETHSRLLSDLDSAVTAFYADLVARNLQDKVTIVIYSEFGRRIQENASLGTDHGTAGPVFVIGGKVKGGFYGEMPSLTRVDTFGDLKYTVDFRSIYATLLDRWLQAPSKDILGATFQPMSFL